MRLRCRTSAACSGATSRETPETVASPIPTERLQNAEMAATSIAETPAVAYRRKRIAAPVNAANPSVWPNEYAMNEVNTMRPYAIFLPR